MVFSFESFIVVMFFLMLNIMIDFLHHRWMITETAKPPLPFKSFVQKSTFVNPF